MSDFDPSAFLETVFVEPSITEKLLCPMGEYLAVIDKVEGRAWSKDGKSGVAMDVLWSIEDQAARDFCKRDKVLVKQGIMFSLTSDGLIDMEKAKNDPSFGKLRAALDLNEGKFSPAMLPGRMARIQVKHRTTNKDGVNYTNEDVAAVTHS